MPEAARRPGRPRRILSHPSLAKITRDPRLARILAHPFLAKLTGGGSRSLMVVSASSMAAVGAAFLRGIILAHLLTPREFGLGVILITLTGALDMFADAGLDRFVIQSRFGFREDIIRTSHYFRVVGSLLVAAAIVALAYPLALLFHAPTMFPAIALTGGVVALRGFVDLRYKLQQRAHRFEAEARIEISRSAAEVVVLLATALIFHSYWAVIAGAYVNAVTHLLLSHRAAAEPYRLAPRKRLLGLVGKFSSPIYVNAALLLAAIQGDRLVVATLFDKSELAFYTVACAISQGLMVVLNRITTSLLLPRMASKVVTFEARRRQVNRLGLAMIALSTAFLICMTIFGPLVTPVVYGARYHGLVAIIFASSIVNMIQIEQVWVTTLLMANGRTASFPVITVMRASAVPIAIVFAKIGASLLAIPLAFAVGAAFSLAATYYATSSLKLIDRRLIALSFARTVLFIAAAPALATAFHVGGAN